MKNVLLASIPEHLMSGLSASLEHSSSVMQHRQALHSRHLRDKHLTKNHHLFKEHRRERDAETDAEQS